MFVWIFYTCWIYRNSKLNRFKNISMSNKSRLKMLLTVMWLFKITNHLYQNIFLNKNFTLILGSIALSICCSFNVSNGKIRWFIITNLFLHYFQLGVEIYLVIRRPLSRTKVNRELGKHRTRWTKNKVNKELGEQRTELTKNKVNKEQGKKRTG